MRFEYSPAAPDDWPSAIAVTATEAGEDSGIEEGETRFYEPNWKHRVAGNTIREQRVKIEELEARVNSLVGELGDTEGQLLFVNSRFDDLKTLASDMLPVIVGWAAKLNELGGASVDDLEAYPMATAKQLCDRWNAFGFEVPDEMEH